MGRDRHCIVRIYHCGVAIGGMGRDRHCRVRIYQRCSRGMGGDKHCRVQLGGWAGTDTVEYRYAKW